MKKNVEDRHIAQGQFDTVWKQSRFSFWTSLLTQLTSLCPNTGIPITMLLLIRACHVRIQKTLVLQYLIDLTITIVSFLSRYKITGAESGLRNENDHDPKSATRHLRGSEDDTADLSPHLRCIEVPINH
jgi:hypothetical protein